MTSSAVAMFDSLLPSDEWQSPLVHWHAFAETREPGVPAPRDRTRFRHRQPDAVLRDPCAVATWIDGQTRQHVTHREVWAAHGREWVAIGDEHDLEHLRRENYGIASRGDSIHTDIYSDTVHHDLIVEAVTDDQCIHGCAVETAC